MDLARRMGFCFECIGLKASRVSSVRSEGASGPGVLGIEWCLRLAEGSQRIGKGVMCEKAPVQRLGRTLWRSVEGRGGLPGDSHQASCSGGSCKERLEATDCTSESLLGKAMGLGSEKAEGCHVRMGGGGSRCLSWACCVETKIQPVSCMSGPCACAAKLEQAWLFPATPGDLSVTLLWVSFLVGPPT